MICLNCRKPIDKFANHCDFCGAAVIHLPVDDLSSPILKRVGSPGYVCFMLHDKFSEATIFKEPDEKSKIMYSLGKGEPILIVSERENWFEVLLPGTAKGFILKSSGRKLEISSEKIKDPLGYYRVNTEIVQYTDTLHGHKSSTKIKAVRVFALPDNSSEVICVLQYWQCVPIIEDKVDWFKIQLDDGVRGFVDKKYGIRTLRKESLPLPPSPDEKSGSSVLGGITTFVGLMVLATAIGGINQGLKDVGSN